MPTMIPVSMLFPNDARFHHLQQSLPTISANERKNFVTLCRAQYVPLRHEAKILSYQVFGSHLGIETLNTPFASIVRTMKPLIENPFYAGLVLDIVRSCEPTREEREEFSQKSWFKEVAACNTQRKESSLNYGAIFDRERFTEELIPGVQARPEVNAFIHQILVKWREDVQSKVLFPRMSRRACSRWSARRMTELWPEWRLDPAADENGLCNQVMFEKLYAETGLEADGPCEIRQKLYRSGITPRSYFAQGGDAYKTSKFLQDPCSMLVDGLPVTNHVLRLIPTNLRLDNIWQHVFIYDLTSFTSMFHEFLPFIRQLAEFCRGCPVQVWDGRYGVVTEDLGELWSTYADVNASNPSYSPERWNKDETRLFYHMCAGFLGVYGNLMICTFLHGVVLLAVIGDVKKCYTAGDDAGAVLMCLLVLTWEKRGAGPKPGNSSYDDVSVLFYALSLLGIIQWSKVFTTQEEGAVALKRPLRQVEGVLHSPQMVIWPQSILIHMYVNWKEHKDPRFLVYYMFNTRSECRSAIIGEVTRFLSSVAAMNHRATDEDLEVVKKYMGWIYSQIGADIGGLVPQFSSSTYYNDFIPTIDKSVSDFRLDPIRYTIGRLWHGYVMVPERRGESDYKERIGTDYSVGDVFVSPKTKLLAWLSKLAYVKERALVRTVFGEPGYDLLLREYDKSVQPPAALYEFSVVKLPDHMMPV